MRALVRSPLVAAMAGGAVVAVALLALGVTGGDHTTTTVIQQAPMAATANADRDGGAGDGGAPGRADAPTAHDIYERDAPGVVFVRAHADAQASSAFGAPQTPQSESTGTGFVIDAEGHILTNHHVVGDAREVSVGFSDDRTLTARVLGDDPTNDLALLEVDPSKAPLHPLVLGDSSMARVGDPVLAIGNPFGLDRTLTTGVVSALQRQLTAPNGFTIQHVIQTDAPINPGNSGGPLLDAAGRVIGITSQIQTAGSGGSVGIGFAVPINTAKQLLPQLKQPGSVRHAYVGITGLTIDSSFASLQLRVGSGVLVQTVYANGPAGRAGLRGGTIESQIDGQRVLLGGDVIQSIDGRSLTSMEQLSAAVATLRPGDKIRLGILRGGENRQLEITLGTAPRQLPAQAQTP